MLQELINVHEMFEDIADLMLLKVKGMDEACTASEEWCRTLEQIKKGELRDDQIDRKEQAFKHKSVKWRAFRTHMDQRGMVAAPDYHDQWFKSSIAALNSYYICRAGGHDVCRTVTNRAYWGQKYPGMLATRQKLYCPGCEAGCENRKVRWP